MQDREKILFPSGERIRQQRLELKMGQQQLADLAGVTVQTQRNYESGRRAPDAGYLKRIKEVGVDVQYVLTGISRLMDRVHQLMDEEKLEPEDLAAEIGEKPETIRQALEGDAALSEVVLLKIIETFKVSADWLLRGTGRMYHDSRAGVHLLPDQAALLDNYDKAPDDIRAAVDSILAAYAKKK